MNVYKHKTGYAVVFLALNGITPDHSYLVLILV